MGLWDWLRILIPQLIEIKCRSWKKIWDKYFRMVVKPYAYCYRL